jgi:hypothetical protein
MSKVRAFVAAVLVSIPMLSLDAAQLPAPHGAVPFMSDPRPTTVNGCCMIIVIGGMYYCIPC